MSSLSKLSGSYERTCSSYLGSPNPSVRYASPPPPSFPPSRFSSHPRPSCPSLSTAPSAPSSSRFRSRPRPSHPPMPIPRPSSPSSSSSSLSSFALRCGDRVCRGTPSCCDLGHPKVMDETKDWTNLAPSAAPTVSRQGGTASRFQSRPLRVVSIAGRRPQPSQSISTVESTTPVVSTPKQPRLVAFRYAYGPKEPVSRPLPPIHSPHPVDSYEASRDIVGVRLAEMLVTQPRDQWPIPWQRRVLPGPHMEFRMDLPPLGLACQAPRQPSPSPPPQPAPSPPVMSQPVPSPPVKLLRSDGRSTTKGLEKEIMLMDRLHDWRVQQRRKYWIAPKPKIYSPQMPIASYNASHWITSRVRSPPPEPTVIAAELACQSPKPSAAEVDSCQSPIELPAAELNSCQSPIELPATPVSFIRLRPMVSEVVDTNLTIITPSSTSPPAGLLTWVKDLAVSSFTWVRSWFS